MYGKKNLMFLAAVLALALPLVFAGNALAIFAGDGSKPNAATGGWDITDYGKCVAGVKTDGTIVIDTAHNLSLPDCIDHTYSYLSTGLCTTTNAAARGNSDDVSHYWTNTCVDASGNGISMAGLDRTAANCALKGGTWQSACTNSWVYTGPNNDGIGYEGGGFCYTTVVTGASTTGSLGGIEGGYNDFNCPTTITGMSSSGTGSYYKCTYSYGVAGVNNGALTKKEGGTYAAATTWVDLTALNQGQCLAAGGTWGTGVIKSAVTSLGTTSVTQIATIEDTRAGCLECHNSVSQRNGYAERWKEPYLKTGHKNMLRKVTAGVNLAGPDGAVYTAAAAVSGNPQNLNFATGEVTIGASTYPLMYLFGDWMAAAPDGLDTVVWNGSAKYNNGSGYSCASCHTTGWMNTDTTKGVCSISSLTTQAACVGASGVWYPSSGTQGASYNPAKPGADWTGDARITVNGDGTITGITGKWDRDGIQCSRCHYAVFSKTSPAPAGTSGHNVTPNPGTANHQVNNICFGCHQAIAKENNHTGTNNDMGNPAWNIPVKNTLTAPAYQPEFNSHPIGNEFLNSPHSLWTGTIIPNSLGKYDLAYDAAGNYASSFGGYICKTSNTYGSGSILAEVWKNGVNTRITTLADCQLANSYLVGSVPTPTTVTGVWQKENKGACTTCHDVHQSLFDPAATEPLKRECETCHEDKTGTGGTGYAAAGVPQIDQAVMTHPRGPNTPWDKTLHANACESCHMPKATDGGFPVHLWRINTDVTYTTFPSAAEFLSTGATTTKKNANTAPDGAYTNAVWLDLDLACGQCHGSLNGTPRTGAPVLTKAQLALTAPTMHTGSSSTTNFGSDCVSCHTKTYNHPTAANTPGLATDSNTCITCHQAGASTVHSGTAYTMDIDATCGQCHGGSAGAGAVTEGAPYFALSTLQGMATSVHTSAPPANVQAPTVGHGLVTQSSWTVTFTDTSSDPYGDADVVTVGWGDGSSSTGVIGDTFSHAYASTRARNFKITHVVTSKQDPSKKATESFMVNVPQRFTVSGTVKTSAGAALTGATVSLKNASGHTVKYVKTGTGNSFSFTNVLPGAYTIRTNKTGYTFSDMVIPALSSNVSVTISAN